MAHVDHDACFDADSVEAFLGVCDAYGIEIGAVGAAAQNDMAVRVAGCLEDCRMTLFGDGEKNVWVALRLDGVYADLYGAVGAVLEADRA